MWGRRVVGLEATGDVGTAKVSFAVPVSRVTCPLPCRCPVWRVNRRARVPCGLSLRRPDLLARPANGVRSRRSRLARPARPDVGSTCCAPRRPFVLFLPARSFVASDHYCGPHRKGSLYFVNRGLRGCGRLCFCRGWPSRGVLGDYLWGLLPYGVGPLPCTGRTSVTRCQHHEKRGVGHRSVLA